MADYSVLTKPIPKVDSLIKATGAAKYGADLVQPGMLYGKILMSPYAHANILSIDTSQAQKLPGVRAVATGKDLKGFKIGVTSATRDQPLLAYDKVRFVGEAVACVAAIDEDIAEEALNLIKVDYEPLPAVLDIEEALKPEAARIHADKKNNIMLESHWHWGDVQKGLAESDYVREDVFRTPLVRQAFLEPLACIGLYEPTGEITAWRSGQSPLSAYRTLSAAFDVPESKVRIIQAWTGGGFGARAEANSLDVCSVLLSKKAGGRPVKIVYSQSEVFTQGTRRMSVILRLKTGVKKDGTLMAQHLTAIQDGGAYTSVGPMSNLLLGAYMTLPYKLPNWKYDGYRVYTSRQPCAPQRGHGIAHGRFAGDVQLDMIAEGLGIDPVDMRLKNAIEPNHTTINGVIVRSCGLKECIEKAADAAGWKDKWGKKRRQGEIAYGIGFAAAPYCTGVKLWPMYSTCTVLVKLNADGTVSLASGATDIGQGCYTMLCQIVAEELGLKLEEVHIGQVDTQTTPVDLGTFSSRVTACAGAAAKAAAEDARKQLAEVAAEPFKANAKDIEFKNGRLYVKGDPERGMSFGRVCRIALLRGKPVTGIGYGNLNCGVPDFEHGMGDWTSAFAFCAQAVEVEINVETGQAKVVDTTVASDSGTVLNPLIVEGQVHGCIHMGLGQTLTEELVYDNKGHLLNDNFADYKIPRAPDMPKMHLIPVETFEPNNVYGVKEGSEAPLVTTYPAIVSAIYDAIGVWIRDLPVTPEKILRALKEKSREQKP